MSRRLYCTGLLIAALVALTAWPSLEVFAQNAKKAKAKPPVDSDKLAAAEFVGTLKVAPGSDRMFTLDVEQDQLVPTGKGARLANTNTRPSRPPSTGRINSSINRMQQAMQHGQQAQFRLNSAKNASERNRAQKDLGRAQADLNKAEVEYQNALAQYVVQSNAVANAALVRAIRRAGTGIPTGYKVVKKITPVEFQAADTAKVRTMVLPEEFDEKGNPKKRTKEELAELKGKDKKLPGYESTMENLQTGQVLRVTLATTPTKAANKDDAKNPDKDKDKDPVDPEAGKKKQVKQIVILKDAPGDGPAKKGNKAQ